MAKRDGDNKEIQVVSFKRGRVGYYVLGTTPLIMNRMSEKAKRQLLLPPQRKNAADKAGSLKHDPTEEFRASSYRLPDDSEPTLLAMPTTAFKGALCSAALDMPGAAKTQIGRLTYIDGDLVPVYGVPELFMSVVRSADINKTPDVRSRVILRRWACVVEIAYVLPILREVAVTNLLAAAGLTIGVGDFRQGKGRGNYGLFTLVDEKNETWNSIVENGGRQAQVDALEHPVCYDLDTQDLLDWYNTEAVRRGFKIA